MQRTAQCLGSVVLAISLAAIAVPARAQLPQEEDESKEYPKVEIAAYIWGTMVASKFDSDRGEVKSYISFSDLLSDLNGGLMLHGRVQTTEQWSIVGDFFWAHLRADDETKQVKLGPRENIVVNGKLKAALGLWIAELNTGYKLFRLGSLFSNRPSDERHTTGEMYFGGRVYSVNPDMEVTVSSNVPALNGKRSIGNNQVWVDPVVGLRFGIDLSKTAQLGIMGDVGGFNLAGYSSEFSWSQTTLLSWNFAESWRLHMGYRFLDFKRDFHSGKAQVQLRGPLIAIGYVF